MHAPASIHVYIAPKRWPDGSGINDQVADWLLVSNQLSLITLKSINVVTKNTCEQGCGSRSGYLDRSDLDKVSDQNI